MASEVVMPQMGAEMQEGTILRWLKKEGDAVDRGEVIAEIETDKANIEIEAFDSGVFRKILSPEGATVPVGQVIGVIAGQQEDISAYEKQAVPSGAATGAGARSNGQAVAQTAPPQPPAAGLPPRTQDEERRMEAAPEPPPAQEQAPPPAEERRPGAEQPAAAPATNGHVRASPLARRIADERGVDLRQVRGTGPEGRILRRDVEAMSGQQPSTPSSPQPEAAPQQPAPPVQREQPAVPPPAPTPAGAERIEQSRMRQAIARRMAESKRQAPHYYLTMEIDMTEALRLRTQLNAALPEDGRISVNDLIVRAAAKALEKYPRFNAWYVDGQVQQHRQLNICIAVALEDGLIAPALMDVASKPLPQLARESRSLAERARAGTLRADEFSQGTFTVSNLGMYGIETLIPIIQPPQAAILGVGRVSEMPAVREGQVVVRQVVKVALAADHRVTDGAEGAQFLAELRARLENPVTLLL